MQWKFGASEKQMNATLELLNGELGDIIREGKDLPPKVSAADRPMEEQVLVLRISFVCYAILLWPLVFAVWGACCQVARVHQVQ